MHIPVCRHNVASVILKLSAAPLMVSLHGLAHGSASTSWFLTRVFSATPLELRHTALRGASSSTSFTRCCQTVTHKQTDGGADGHVRLGAAPPGTRPSSNARHLERYHTHVCVNPVQSTCDLQAVRVVSLAEAAHTHLLTGALCVHPQEWALPMCIIPTVGLVARRVEQLSCDRSFFGSLRRHLVIWRPPFQRSCSGRRMIWFRALCCPA